jgi:hypothetical protein
VQVDAFNVLECLKGQHQGDVVAVGGEGRLFLCGVEQYVDEVDIAEGSRELFDEGTVATE